MSWRPRWLSRIDFLASSVRELTDALVIFSVVLLVYEGVVHGLGLPLLHRLFGTQIARPSWLYFIGVALVVFSIRRIVDQRNEQKKRVMAEQYDLLTKLPNRHQFQVNVSAVLKRSNNIITVVLIGLDQFKKLNEMYGHVGCEQVLVQLGTRVRGCADAADIVARISDDEFVICLVGVTPDGANKVAETIIESVKRPVQIGIENHSINVNLGIAQSGYGYMTVDELLRCAQVALSRARMTKVDCCFFDPKMDAYIRERSVLERDLREAIGGFDVRPFYQPIVNLQTKRIIGFESLARWHHPINGLVMPDTFIPLAEELGIIDVLSGQLFGDACRDAATWPEYISLSFNFSPTQLSDRRLAANILTVLHNTGLKPYRLEVEITETALVVDFESTLHTIETLRSAGVKIALDDFGTGYSGLSQLYQLRFDKLKIDKRFIQELGKSAESDAFLRAIFGLCKGLDLPVTAEGIETAAQAELALRHGAHLGQGFLFGKAVPAEEVLQLLTGGPQQSLSLERSTQSRARIAR